MFFTQSPREMQQRMGGKRFESRTKASTQILELFSYWEKAFVLMTELFVFARRVSQRISWDSSSCADRLRRQSFSNYN